LEKGKEEKKGKEEEKKEKRKEKESMLYLKKIWEKNFHHLQVIERLCMAGGHF
jgi:hypothetical protein